MANFDLAYRFMAPHEWNQRKNFTDDPDDPGGPTKWGITLRSWQIQGSLGDLDHDGDVDVIDLQLATDEHAKHFYSSRYWLWDGIKDDVLAAKLFDIGVNLGPGTAVLYLQTALCDLGTRVAIDSLLGPKTLAAANSAAPMVLLDAIAKTQRSHYEEWISRKPAREKYRRGLMARAEAIPALAKEANA